MASNVVRQNVNTTKNIQQEYTNPSEDLITLSSLSLLDQAQALDIQSQTTSEHRLNGQWNHAQEDRDSELMQNISNYSCLVEQNLLLDHITPLEKVG